MSSLKKVFCEISQNSSGIVCAGISFLIKLNSVDLQLNKKENLVQVFLVNFAKFVRTLFCRTPPGELLLNLAVSIVLKGELANETVNYDTKTKT